MGSQPGLKGDGCVTRHEEPPAFSGPQFPICRMGTLDSSEMVVLPISCPISFLGPNFFQDTGTHRLLGALEGSVSLSHFTQPRLAIACLRLHGQSAWSPEWNPEVRGHSEYPVRVCPSCVS